MSSAPPVVGATRPLKAFGVVVAGFVVVWVVLDRSATWLNSNVGEAGVLVCGLVILTALAVERLLFGTGARRALRRLGFGRPNVRAVLVGLLAALAMVAFYPILSLVAGARVSLRDGWILVALGLFAQHGIAEETLFRGYLFRHLREGRAFWRAAFLSMAPFVAVHLLLLVHLDFPVAVASILVAVATAFPLAYMFERDNNTIWAPALLHGAAHSIKLVSIPDEVFPTAALIWFAVVAVAPYLVFAFPKRFFAPGSRVAQQTAIIPGGTGSMTTKKPDRSGHQQEKDLTIYEIRVKGHLDPRWSEWFDGLEISNLENGEAVLSGEVVDQAALHGVLIKVRDLGLPLVAVRSTGSIGEGDSARTSTTE